MNFKVYFIFNYFCPQMYAIWLIQNAATLVTKCVVISLQNIVEQTYLNSKEEPSPCTIVIFTKLAKWTLSLKYPNFVSPIKLLIVCNKEQLAALEPCQYFVRWSYRPCLLASETITTVKNVLTMNVCPSMHIFISGAPKELIYRFSQG